MSFKLTHDNGKVISRIIHASDIHIRTGDLERSRYHEYRDVFQVFFDKLSLIESLHECVIVLTGDIFHNKGKIEPAGICLAHYLLDNLLKFCDVLFICGNHDYRQDDPDIPDMIDSIYRNYFENKINSIHKAYYLNKTGCYQYYNLNFGVVDIRDILKNYNTSGKYDTVVSFPKPVKDTTNIALFHGMGFELSWFDGYEYALLGDNHKFSYSFHPLCAGYAGSLIQQDFGENFYEHGFVLVNLQNKTIKHIELFNNYAFCTLKHYQNKLYIHNKHKTWIDIAEMEQFPKFPSIRTYDEESVDAIQTYCINHTITPKCLQLITTTGPEEITHSHDKLSQIEELNSTHKWIEYLQQYMTIDKELIFHPELLKLPITDDNFDFIKKYQERNTKIQKAIDEYNNHINKTNKYTGKVFLKNMEWAYLMCFGENNTFDFSKLMNKIVLLNGKNAMGKSSFLDILCIALYGEPTKMRHMINGRKYTDKIIHDKRPINKTAPHVKLLFTIENDTFELYRSFSSQSAKDKEHLLLQTAIQLYKITDTDKTIFLEGSTLVDKWVSDNIGDMESVLMSTMLCQIDLNNFFYLKQDEQKVILDKALQLENVSLYGKILKESILAHQDIIQQIKTASLTLQNIKNTNMISEEEYSNLTTKLEQLQTLQSIYHKYITKNLQEKVPSNIEELYKEAEAEYEMIEDKNVDLENYYTLKEKVNSLEKIFKTYEDVDIIKNSEELYHKWNTKFEQFMQKKPSADVSMEWIKDSFEKYKIWKKDNTVDYNLEEIEKDVHSVPKPNYPRKLLNYNGEMTHSKFINITEHEYLDSIDIQDIETKYNKYKTNLETYHTKTKEFEELTNILHMIKLEHNPDCKSCQCNKEYITQLNSYCLQLETYLNKTKLQIKLWESKISEYDKILSVYPAYCYSVQTINNQWEMYEKYLKNKDIYKKAQQYTIEKQKWSDFVTKYEIVYNDYLVWLEEYTIIIQKLEKYKKSYEKQKMQNQLVTLQESYNLIKQSVEAYMNYEKYKNLYYGEKLAQVEKEIKSIETSIVKYNTHKQQYTEQMRLYTKLKDLEDSLATKLNTIKELDTYFIGDKTQNDGYKEWIYKNQVIPMLNSKMNLFLSMFEDFKFEMIYNKKNFIYLLHDRGNKPTLDKASGYQNFIIGIALRITLSSIGAIGQQLKHLFIDEGFTACDYNNIKKVPQLLQNILTYGNYHSIILMSHLESVRECTEVNINIIRKDPFSYIQFGTYPDYNNTIQKRQPKKLKK